MPGHKHAALMLEYAKDCETDAEAFKNWEVNTGDNNWDTLIRHPAWAIRCEYRRKPKPVSPWTKVKRDAKIIVDGHIRRFPLLKH